MNGLSEAVIVCRGNLTDPGFFLYLAKVKTKLQTILSTDKQSLQVDKVERCNSVRVTFRLPASAACKLRKVSLHHSSQLAHLGIKSVTVDGTQVNATLGPSLLSNASTNGSDSGFESGSTSAASAPDNGVEPVGTSWPPAPAPVPLPSDTSRRNVLNFLMQNETPSASGGGDVFRVPVRPVASPATTHRGMVNNSPLLVGLLRSQSPGGTPDYYEPGETTIQGGPVPSTYPTAARPMYSVNNRYVHPQEYVQSYPPQQHPSQAGYYQSPQQTLPLVPNCDDPPPPKKRKRTTKKKVVPQAPNPYVEVTYEPSTSQQQQPHSFPQPVRPTFDPQQRPVGWNCAPSPMMGMNAPPSQWIPSSQPPTTPSHSTPHAPFFGSQPCQPHNHRPASLELDRGPDIPLESQPNHSNSNINRPSSRQQRPLPNEDHIKNSIEAVLDQVKNDSIPQTIESMHSMPNSNSTLTSNGPTIPSNFTPLSSAVTSQTLRASSPVISTETQLLERLKGKLNSSITSPAHKGYLGECVVRNGGVEEMLVNGDVRQVNVDPRAMIHKVPNPMLHDNSIDSNKLHSAIIGVGVRREEGVSPASSTGSSTSVHSATSQRKCAPLMRELMEGAGR